MSSKSLKAQYNTTSWDEKTISEEGAAIKITRVKSERKFTGDLVGTGVAEYVLVYHPGSASPSEAHPGTPTSTYTGICHFKGSVAGSPEGEAVFIVENGSFVSTAQADWIIDEKSAIGGLKGLKGKGGYKHPEGAGFAEGTDVWFEYSL